MLCLNAAAEDKDGAKDDEAGSPLLRDVFFHSLDGKDMGILWEAQPCFVVMYDPDVAFVRQLEVRLAGRSQCVGHLVLSLQAISEVMHRLCG